MSDVMSVAKPQRASRPRQMHLAPADHAEFVICDQSIETFFSDQKSRGFNLHKSHISNPDRLSRLMMGACLAYYWIIYLGMMALEGEWFKRFHRTNRCDLSLFQLGLRMLKYLIKTSMPIPVVFGPPMRP